MEFGGRKWYLNYLLGSLFVHALIENFVKLFAALNTLLYRPLTEVLMAPAILVFPPSIPTAKAAALLSNPLPAQFYLKTKLETVLEIAHDMFESCRFCKIGP